MQILTIEHKTDLYYKMLSFREDYLRKPLGLHFTLADINNEQDDYFFIVLENENIIGSCILTPISTQIIKLRQMAIHPNFQKKYIGKSILQYCEKVAFKKEYQQIVLHARETAIDFYKKNSYTAIGDLFIEVSIPHIKMFKNKNLEI